MHWYFNVVLREYGLTHFDKGVNWRNFSSEDISQIIACLGGPRLSKICHLFAQTYWNHSGGVPDLCLWRIDTHEFKLVEVKGQGDVLSEKQKLWLECLREFGVQAETLHVKIRKEIE
jgi:Fanconi-associated nuclease 1